MSGSNHLERDNAASKHSHLYIMGWSQTLSVTYALNGPICYDFNRTKHQKKDFHQKTFCCYALYWLWRSERVVSAISTKLGHFGDMLYIIVCESKRIISF